jgi:tRNA (mo5U34)-methyltransferase
MKNVWFLPTCALLERMLHRCGFDRVEVVDVTQTTVEEQRQTEWMTFDSLDSFLDVDDPNRTVEGYPAPLRAIVLARRT